MPYFITDKSPDCAGWATIKEDGEVIGCHTTKQAAIDQMVAVSIAEDMEPGGVRTEESDEYVIVDIDGTLLNGSRPIRRVVEFVNKLHQDYYIYIVTARMEDEEEATMRDLQAAGVRYDDIEFKEDESMSTPEYKADKARDIQEDGAVVLAIDNDADNLAAFRELGIPVLDPADIEEGQEPELRALPSNYRPSSSADVPANHNCGNCGYYKNFWCKRWDAQVSPAYYCNAWEPVQGLPNDNPGQTVQTGNVSDEDPNYYTDYPNTYDRQLSFDVPVYIRAAARKGLDYYGQGLAGDGLVARTVREARDMAAGRITEDKVVRANAWGARHLVDLDAPKNSDSSNDQFPGPGAVAFYLWGINPLNPEPAMNWFARQAERVQAERADAPAPAKDQIKGSEKNPEGSASGAAGSSTIELTEAIESGLSNKVSEHNDALESGSPSWKRATVGMLRAVYRRGAGAYSTSHRPGVSRNAWAMARVNAFLVLLRSGRPANPAYIGDNDLLPKGHPRSSRN